MLQKKIEDDMREAIKSKDRIRLGALRMLNSGIKNRLIEIKEKSLSDEEVLSLLQKQVKKHRESIDQFKRGERQDLVEAEEQQMKVLTAYLPEQLSDNELETIVEESLEEVQATCARDIGIVMKNIMPKVRGRADGKKVNALVLSKLS